MGRVVLHGPTGLNLRSHVSCFICLSEKGLYQCCQAGLMVESEGKMPISAKINLFWCSTGTRTSYLSFRAVGPILVECLSGAFELGRRGTPQGVSAVERLGQKTISPTPALRGQDTGAMYRRETISVEGFIQPLAVCYKGSEASVSPL